MVAPYKARKAFDGRMAYDIWLRLVADEQLYDAMLDGTHRNLATSRGLSEDELLIIEDFRDQPGTKWHMENLRFRCTTMIARIIEWHLPATAQLLTGRNMDWLRDLAYEYMSYHHWDDLGHHRRLIECQRFSRFVRDRIAKRRPPPPHLETVLSYELALIELIQAAGAAPADAWPKKKSHVGQDLGALKPRHAPVNQLFELPVDIVSWLADPSVALRIDGPGPVHALAWIPSLADQPKVMKLSSQTHKLYEALRGERTVTEAIGRSGGDRSSHLSAIGQWLEQGALVV